MNIIQACYARHAVRHFDGKPLSWKHQQDLREIIDKINQKNDLHIQLIANEPKAFGGARAKMCNFTGCVNYLALIGKKSKDLKEKLGYFGEKIVLKAQQMGINSCWVYLTYNKIKEAYDIRPGEKLVCVVALGYGLTQGHPHESKRFGDVVKARGEFPEWFKKGVKIALIAPTGKNQQKFTIELVDSSSVRIKNRSLCKDLDLGILKYHFEIGTGGAKFDWVK